MWALWSKAVEPTQKSENKIKKHQRNTCLFQGCCSLGPVASFFAYWKRDYSSRVAMNDAAACFLWFHSSTSSPPASFFVLPARAEARPSLFSVTCITLWGPLFMKNYFKIIIFLIITNTTITIQYQNFGDLEVCTKAFSQMTIFSLL